MIVESPITSGARIITPDKSVHRARTDETNRMTRRIELFTPRNGEIMEEAHEIHEQS